MNKEYFEQLSDMAKKAQEPFQALAELNVKTLQGFTYLKPDELVNIKKPEELLEKQIEMIFANSRKALDYMEKSSQILEKTMFSMLQDVKTKVEETKKKM